MAAKLFGITKSSMSNTAAFFKKHRLTQCAVLALLTLLVMEAICRHSIVSPFLWIAKAPYAFFFNYLIVLLTFSVAIFFPKETFSLTLTASFWIILSIVNGVLLLFRTTPFSAIDLSIVINMLGIIDIYLNIFQLILIVVGSLAFITLMVILWKKTAALKINFFHNSVFLMAVIILFLLSAFLGKQTGLLERKFPNLNQAYKDYGFAYCFSLSIFDVGVNEPDEYTDDTVEKVLLEISSDKNTPPENTPNIIVVQLESFFDVNRITNLISETDPIPNFTSLKQNFPHGLITVPSIGGGTANTEFEVLTGMNLDHFGPGEYPYKTVLQSKVCETPAFTLKNYGYTAHAIHNHEATFYDRHLVYPSLGFDTFTPLEMMMDIEQNELGWAKDSMLTKNIINCLESSSGRDFVFTVSVQAHGKYPEYDILPEEKIKLHLQNVTDEGIISQYNYFVQQLNGTDRFIGELISRLNEFDEPVAVLFYGDHFPTLHIEDGCLVGGSQYQTDWAVWSNYTLSGENKDMTSYQLMSHFLGMLGTNLGNTTKLHQMSDKIENYQEKLELLEYDMLYGEMIAFGKTCPYEKTNLLIGVFDVYVTDIESQDELVYIRGNNFNQYTKVKLDGRVRDTEFINENCISLNNINIKGHEKLQLIQLTFDRVELRTSAEYMISSFLDKE